MRANQTTRIASDFKMDVIFDNYNYCTVKIALNLNLFWCFLSVHVTEFLYNQLNNFILFINFLFMHSLILDVERGIVQDQYQNQSHSILLNQCWKHTQWGFTLPSGKFL